KGCRITVNFMLRSNDVFDVPSISFDASFNPIPQDCPAMGVNNQNTGCDCVRIRLCGPPENPSQETRSPLVANCSISSPMPGANVTTAISVQPGVFTNIRAA